MRVCENCKKDFLPAYLSQDVCSSICRKERKEKQKEKTITRASQEKFANNDKICQAPRCRKRVVVWHHVLYQQHMYKFPPQVKEDKRNALGLCFSCHESHHKNKKLPFSCLHQCNLDFVFRMLGEIRGFAYLCRYYRDDGDPRLDFVR